MTKGDKYTKETLERIIENGCLDNNPRPHWADGVKAHSYSVNNAAYFYSNEKGEIPLITLRPIATKNSIGEILWIYRDQDSNVYNLEMKYGVRWWRSWVINPYHYDKDGNLLNGENPYINENFYYDRAGKINSIPKSKEEKVIKSYTVDPKTDFDGENILDYATGNVLTKDATIGQTYGSIIRDNKLMLKTFKELEKHSDSRRIIINMWQEEDFKKEHSLVPCAYQTQYFVRHGKDGFDYLDMNLYQRSSDYCTAGTINQMQYVFLQHILAKEFNYRVGDFAWFVGNIQIYDRHMDAARELVNRDSIDCNPKIIIDKEVNWNNIMPENIHIEDYPKELIKKKNPQIKFEVAI